MGLEPHIPLTHGLTGRAESRGHGEIVAHVHRMLLHVVHGSSSSVLHLHLVHVGSGHVAHGGSEVVVVVAHRPLLVVVVERGSPHAHEVGPGLLWPWGLPLDLGRDEPDRCCRLRLGLEVGGWRGRPQGALGRGRSGRGWWGWLA